MLGGIQNNSNNIAGLHLETAGNRMILKRNEKGPWNQTKPIEQEPITFKSLRTSNNEHKINTRFDHANRWSSAIGLREEREPSKGNKWWDKFHNFFKSIAESIATGLFGYYHIKITQEDKSEKVKHTYNFIVDKKNFQEYQKTVDIAKGQLTSK